MPTANRSTSSELVVHHDYRLPDGTLLRRTKPDDGSPPPRTITLTAECVGETRDGGREPSPLFKYYQLFEAIASCRRGSYRISDPAAFDMLPGWCEANARDWFELQRGVPKVRVRWVRIGKATLEVTL